MAKINIAGPVKRTRVIIPPGRRLGNVLTSYLRLMSQHEAPEIFDLWCGLGAISSAVGRQVSMDMRYFEVFSNLFIVLTAPAGTARKSTALKNARRLLTTIPGLHFTPQQATPQAMMKRMADIGTAGEEHQSIITYSYEFGLFLGKGSKQDEMADFLCDAYDCNPDFEKETVGRGLESITRPWMNLNAGVTPEWIKDHMSSGALETGMVSRILWIFADQRKLSNPLPERNPEMEQLSLDIINDLTHISTLKGNMTLEPSATEFYKSWYMDDKRFPSSTQTRMGNYYERKHIHLLKTAMLLSLGESDSMVIEKRDLVAALEMLEQIEPGMQRAFTGVGKNAFASDLERLTGQISHAGETGIGYGPLLNANYHALQKEELDKVLSQLVSMQRIRLSTGGKYVSRNV